MSLIGMSRQPMAGRHRFKTVGMEAGIPPRILDAIQGHVSGRWRRLWRGALRTQAEARINKLPRIEVARLEWHQIR